MRKIATLFSVLVLALAPLGARAQQDGPVAAQDEPGAAQDEPGAEQDGPGAAQDEPEAAQDEPKAAQDEPKAAPASQPAGPASQPAGPASQPAAAATDAATEPAAETEARPSDVGPPIESSFPGAALQGSSGDPTVGQRRLIAYVSSGVAVVALAGGITAGVMANREYGCLADVLACNERLDEPILGAAYLDKKAEVDTLALVADMAYVVAAAATIVAITGYIRGYWLTEEETEVAP